MPDNSAPSDRRTAFSRRRLLATAAGTMVVPVSSAVATESASMATEGGLPRQDSPSRAAQTYINALDAGDRTRVNEVIAPTGALSNWSRTEFAWVESFEIEYVGFETVEKRRGDIIGEIKLTIAGNTGTARYRFREADHGWRIWDAVDGLRSTENLSENAEAVAEAYVAALDAGNRDAVNDLIATGGELSKWSSREFEWVTAFEFDFLDFEADKITGDEVIGDIELTIDGNKETVRYRFHDTGAGRVELYSAVGGIRATGEVSAEAAANAYVAALDANNRGRANELIADTGPLELWSSRDFQWVRAFSVELVGLKTNRLQDDTVVADLSVRLDDSTASVRYKFRRVDDGWKIWEGIKPIR